MPITTADIGEDLVAADDDQLAQEGATRTEEEKTEMYPETLLGGSDDLTVKEREKRRLDLH